MTKAYYLTIEVKSEHLEDGLGYMVAFSLPEDVSSPIDMPEFGAWEAEVRKAVLAAGDQCLHKDPYVKKLALASLMHDLAELNARCDIQVGFLADAPAVQIFSTNPYDNTIEIDFTDRDGHHKINETGLSDFHNAAVIENGRTGLTDITRRHFPFKKAGKNAAPKNQPKP